MHIHYFALPLSLCNLGNLLSQKKMAKLFRQKSFVHIDLLKRNSIYLKVVKKKFLYKVYIWASLCPEEWNVVAGPRIMLGFPWWLCPDNTDNTLTHTHMTRYTHLHTHILVNALEFPTYSKCCPVEIEIGKPQLLHLYLWQLCAILCNFELKICVQKTFLVSLSQLEAVKCHKYSHLPTLT